MHYAIYREHALSAGKTRENIHWVRHEKQFPGLQFLPIEGRVAPDCACEEQAETQSAAERAHLAPWSEQSQEMRSTADTLCVRLGSVLQAIRWPG